MFLLWITRHREGDRKHLLGIVRDPEGDLIHLQRWVCGIVRGSYPCRIPLFGIVKGLRVFLGIARDPEGHRTHVQLCVCGTVRGFMWDHEQWASPQDHVGS